MQFGKHRLDVFTFPPNAFLIRQPLNDPKVCYFRAGKWISETLPPTPIPSNVQCSPNTLDVPYCFGFCRRAPFSKQSWKSPPCRQGTSDTHWRSKAAGAGCDSGLKRHFLHQKHVFWAVIYLKVCAFLLSHTARTSVRAVCESKNAE